MLTAEFDFELPPELIAQTPAPQRDQSRMLVLDRGARKMAHRRFVDLADFLRAGDVLVLNDSRVIPARLRGANASTGGQFELLLLEPTAALEWWVMLRPGKRARPGTQIVLCDRAGIPTQVRATVREKNGEGHCRVVFTGLTDSSGSLETLGAVPLPPYIQRSGAGPEEADRERYQTVFARLPGSVAAPTAGLHFTERLLEELRAQGVEICFVTLHVGPGTFAPVKTRTIAAHVMHEERFEISTGTATAVNRARGEKRRIIPVGTTSLRVLESVAGQNAGLLLAGSGRTKIFIHPPFDFKLADALLTNFHLPRSSLLMLASAFADPGGSRGRELLLTAYAEAIRERYRFFSYGDAMLLV